MGRTLRSTGNDTHAQVERVKEEDGVDDSMATDSEILEESVPPDEGVLQDDGSEVKDETDIEDLDGEVPEPGSWKNNRDFILKLGCLTEHGTPARFTTWSRKPVAVSDNYSITGFHDGGDKVPTMFQINRESHLLLEPEVVGRVLGLPSHGLPIPGSGSKNLKKEVEEFMRKESLENDTVSVKDGIFIECLKPELQEYIKEHRRKKFLAGHPGILPVGQTLAFARSLNYGETYNWADHRVSYVKTTIARDGALPQAAKALLHRYISLALPVVEKEAKVLRSSAEHRGRNKQGGPGKKSIATLHKRETRRLAREETPSNDQDAGPYPFTPRPRRGPPMSFETPQHALGKGKRKSDASQESERVPKEAEKGKLSKVAPKSEGSAKKAKKTEKGKPTKLGQQSDERQTKTGEVGTVAAEMAGMVQHVGRLNNVARVLDRSRNQIKELRKTIRDSVNGIVHDLHDL